jgi:hypothetical protein
MQSRKIKKGDNSNLIDCNAIAQIKKQDGHQVKNRKKGG